MRRLLGMGDAGKSIVKNENEENQLTISYDFVTGICGLGDGGGAE